MGRADASPRPRRDLDANAWSAIWKISGMRRIQAQPKYAIPTTARPTAKSDSWISRGASGGSGDCPQRRWREHPREPVAMRTRPNQAPSRGRMNPSLRGPKVQDEVPSIVVLALKAKAKAR